MFDLKPILLALALTMPVFAQEGTPTPATTLEVRAASWLKIQGAGDVETIGDHVLIPTAAKLEFKPVGIIQVDTPAANVEVNVSDANRNPVEFETIGDGAYCIEKTGKFWVEVTVIDFTKNIYSKKQLVLTVGGTPTPVPPGPGPGPQPGPTPDTGLFESIAKRVNEAATNMQPDKRFSLAAVFEAAAQKLESRDFFQLSQSAKYIQDNQPGCTPESGCKPVYDLILNDSRTRTLSIAAAISYYREIAKGLR